MKIQFFDHKYANLSTFIFVETERLIIIFYFMNSTGNYLKWTGRLLEEFSSTGFEFSSTQNSYYKPLGDKTHCFQQNQKQMQQYRRYADSLDAKRNNYLPTQNLHSYLSRLPFVQYTHQSNKTCNLEQHKLKKRSMGQNKKIKPCQYCKCKKQNRKEQKIVQQSPIIIKEIEKVYVPTPPTVIREFIRPPITQSHTNIIFANQQPKFQQIINPREIMLESRPRPASVGRVNFNYSSGLILRDKIMQSGMKQSVILSPNQKQITTPYKLLQFSARKPQQIHFSNLNPTINYRVEQVPSIKISKPVQINRRIDTKYKCPSKFDANGQVLHLVDQSWNEPQQSYSKLAVPGGSFGKLSDFPQSMDTFGKLQ